ncbi:MAG: hypothetical protein K8L99_15880 [Anaerolineae bacterium]|nr:hypothetical protein [Anaerolineae bacterium]
MAQKLNLPNTFPQGNYTPFGYLDNPAHSAVFNRSGLLRTVPPLGMGWWARAMPWPYGIDVERRLAYLSFLYLSVTVGSLSLAPTRTFHSVEDFTDVELVSRYHTKTLLSYDWTYNHLNFSARYHLSNEHALVCIFEVENQGDEVRQVTAHATHIYGYPGPMYWGRDGITSQPANDVSVSKFWAYGDVFALGSDRSAAAYKATASDSQWRDWIAANDLNNTGNAIVRFHEGRDHLYTTMSYPMRLNPGESDSLVLALARDVNEPYTRRRLHEAVQTAYESAQGQLTADEHFYTRAPLLHGDWPESWQHGWIYDLETLRMTVRPPLGIYKHPWDGMQIHSPRVVLGETCLDMECLSYADMERAKEVIYGTFADAPVPNVPCTREDGSMNMIGESGAECGTAPTWGMPFLTIESLYLRDRDDNWIRELYPYLKAFIEWWLENRTDDEGWFHANNSWESGQDGSRRFLHGGAQEGTPATFVRTVDIEAAMAHGMVVMADFARIAGYTRDVEMWQELAADRVERTRSMFVDGWFRDFDARADKPFLIDDYYDVMMLIPLAVGIATEEQTDAVKSKFSYFIENPKHWLEWPSFWQPFSEAAWQAGERELVARELVKVGQRIYARSDSRETSPVAERYRDRLPEEYNYRIPGIASEFWPVEMEGILNGAENYGWGATFPSLVIRNLIGFREGRESFTLAPMLPDSLFEVGKTYGIGDLRWWDMTFDVDYSVQPEGELDVRLDCRLRRPGVVIVKDADGTVVTQHDQPERNIELTFRAVNGAVYTVSVSGF